MILLIYCNKYQYIMGIFGIVYLIAFFILTIILLVSCTVLKHEKSIDKINAKNKNEKKK